MLRLSESVGESRSRRLPPASERVRRPRKLSRVVAVCHWRASVCGVYRNQSMNRVVALAMG